MEKVEVHHAKVEEEEGDDQGEDRSHSDDLEGNVALRADDVLVSGAFALHLACRQAHSTLDDAPALDDTDDAGHGDAADADGASIGSEDLLRRHIAHGGSDGRIPLVQYRVGEDNGHGGHDDPPYADGSHADDEGVTEADDVSQSEHGSTRVEFHDQLGLLGYRLAKGHGAACHLLVPPSEGGHGEVIESADDACQQQRFGLAAALLARDEHLGRSRCLGEGILSVHVLDEILAERNQEQNTQDTTEGRGDEDPEEVGMQVEHVDGRHDEDAACHDSARASSDTLDDDVLAESVLALCRRGKADCDDSDGDSGLEDLAHLQSQIGSGGREEHRHEHAPGHRPCVDLGIILVRTHHRLVLFVRFELAKRALGQFDWFCFLIFHCCYFRLFDALYGCLSLDCCSTCGMCLNAAAASFVFRPPGCPNVLMTDFRCKNT